MASQPPPQYRPRHRASRVTLPIAKVKGVSIELHASLLFLVAFFAVSVISNPSHFGATLGLTLLGLLCVGTSVLFHEFGHAFMASRRGLRVYRIVLGIYFGYTVRERSSNPKDDLLVAMAGPAASLLLALLGFAIFYANDLQISALFSSQPLDLASINEPARTVVTFFALLGLYNLWLCCFNLLPLPHFDGGHILKALFTLASPTRSAQLSHALTHPSTPTIHLVGLLLSLMLLLIGYLLGAHNRSSGMAIAFVIAVPLFAVSILGIIRYLFRRR